MNLNNLEFIDIIKEVESSNNYDCLVPISGGKDGIFILWYLRKHTNLKLLAYHIDNWYISRGASENIDLVCKQLDVDLVKVKISWRECKAIYQQLLLKMGEICIFCEYMIDVLPVIFAVNYGINNIAWGLTPNQLVSKHINCGIKEIDYTFYEKLNSYYKNIFTTILEDHELKDQILKKWFSNSEFKKDANFPNFIFPFYYLDYNAEEVEKLVKSEVNWKRCAEVGGTSSNCVINNLHIYLKNVVNNKDYYKEILNKKHQNNEVTESVVKSALKERGFDDVCSYLKELDIFLDEKELVDTISSYAKSIILRKESNISQ